MDFKADMVIIDYVDYLRGPSKKFAERKDEIDDVFVAVKGMAKELKIPVLTPSQVNRMGAKDQVIEGDFLKYDTVALFQNRPFAVVGNFPYNISSQILFRCLEFKEHIPEIVGMFQKEVAIRISEGPGKKQYGILSVFMQAFYNVEYLFTVDENVFEPPPKVKSGVIRCKRNNRQELECDELFFKKVVKTAFNQRRKTLRNSLKSISNEIEIPSEMLQQRPEHLSLKDFLVLSEQLLRRRQPRPRTTDLL